ncbi:hypothetical protein OAA32_00670 [bacterium]|nr:hypothetical protein [bacterium]
MKLKGGAYEMSSQCLAMFKDPQSFGLNPDEFSNLNFQQFATDKVGGGYKKKVTKKKVTKKKVTKKEDTKKKVTKKKVTKKKVTKKGGGVLGNYINSLQ